MLKNLVVRLNRAAEAFLTDTSEDNIQDANVYFWALLKEFEKELDDSSIDFGDDYHRGYLKRELHRLMDSVVKGELKDVEWRFDIFMMQRNIRNFSRVMELRPAFDRYISEGM